MNKYLFEVCSFNIQSCLIAQDAGASRVELCDNPAEGGTTPSYGLIKLVREKVNIDLYPIIRPRPLNFFYNDEEWEIMLQDIRVCKEIGCDGISVGVQKQNGEIDTDRMKTLVEVAYPMSVTCNRVIDTVPNPFSALEDLIEAGCKRVLTSGGAATALEGVEVLKKMVQQAADRIIIMPGAGVNSENIGQLISESGAVEFHGSARVLADNEVAQVNPNISDTGNMYVADFDEVRSIVEILQGQ